MNYPAEEYLYMKYNYHRHDFDPIFQNVEEYRKRAQRLAESEDPNVISYDVPADAARVVKYDPIMNELLVMNKLNGSFITFYRPHYASEQHPRGYKRNITPLQYVLEGYYLNNE